MRAENGYRRVGAILLRELPSVKPVGVAALRAPGTDDVPFRQLIEGEVADALRSIDFIALETHLNVAPAV